MNTYYGHMLIISSLIVVVKQRAVTQQADI